ncbi:hypothetical protein H5410_034784 [Solanum commersonii]|uniref:Uncharacterized protein n=1 Tax=Solanum commersonii TaxID=4109 RepID=A0A9J5YX03_SOLCO|nr:hypothetical protein H5410_034784 [Solanum commersonii]
MLDEEAPGPNHSVAQLIDECSPKDMSKRYVTATSLVRSSNKPKIGFEICEDLYLAEFFLELAIIEDLYYEKQILEIENCIPQSTMPLDDMMLVVEHENYTEELNAYNILCQFPFNPGATSLNVVVQETVVNFCVWNPGISFKSESLTRSTMKEKPLLLLRSTIMFCSIAYANSVILVWDPEWQCRVHYLIFLCEFTWCMSLANRKGWQFLLVVYPYGSKVMNNGGDEPQVEALKLSCLISHIPTTNEVPPLEKHVSDPPHSKFLTSLLFGLLSMEYVFPSYHSLSNYQVVSSSTQMTMFYTNTSPYYCSTLQFSHWNISDKKGPKRRVISVLLPKAFQHQHNFLVLWRCATMWVEFIQLKGGSLVSYCAEILEVGNWFLLHKPTHSQAAKKKTHHNRGTSLIC